MLAKKMLTAALLCGPLIAGAVELSPSVAPTPNPSSEFDANRFVTCDAHSLISVQMAKKAEHEHRSIEAVLRTSYASPQAIDLKLSRLAQGALRAGLLESAGERALQRFLTGICYQSTN